MQFPESWLREFCNPDLSTEQLAETLTMAGLEVEELKPVAPPFTHIVVGEIKTAEQHPNADRLRVCTVDVGEEQAHNATHAPNNNTFKLFMLLKFKVNRYGYIFSLFRFIYVSPQSW